MESGTTNKVRKYIESHEAGRLFFMDDFLQFGSPDSVRQALTRLCRRGVVKRVATGIYYMPKIDKWDGSHLQPSSSEIAKAVASRSCTRIVPDGQIALNMLGLSTQVPARVSFVTDGAPRKIKTASGSTLEFKHTSDMSWFKYQSEIMLLVVMAMREIGEVNLTSRDMDIAYRHVEKVSKEDFEHDIKLAPLWIIKRLKRA